MHKRLKIKFTLLCACLTGLVLMAACLFAYSSAKLENKTKYDDEFEYQSQTLSVFLAGTKRLEYKQFYSMEQESGMYIFFYDKGTALYSADNYKNDNMELHDEFLEVLKAQYPEIEARGNNGSEPISRRVEFSYMDEPYMGKYVYATANNRQWYSFILLRSVAGQKQEARQLAYTFVFIFILGGIILLFISWILARFAVKPVEKAHQEQKDFIAAASHELKSPLAVITAAADYALHVPETAENSLEKIIRESKRMSSLVDDLLLLSGTETGRWQIKKEIVDLENVLLTVYENFYALARKGGQSLVLNISENGIPPVEADGQRLIQIISVLVSNALSYSPEKSEICISARKLKKEVEIRIIDHGSGIADSDKEDIFKKFYRKDKSHREQNHFGLGLPVAKELADLHGGEIKVRDTAGGGATFSIVLPLHGK